MTQNKLFTQGRIGPLTLRNRSVRSAAFEGMCPDGIPSDSLINYHRSVAAGGIGMTTVAYVSITNGGRTFGHQAWMGPEVVPRFRELTDTVHKEGAAASVQLGHAGNMADRSVSGERAIAPTGRLNLYGLTLPRKMTESNIDDIIKAHGAAVRRAKEAGFDAVEIHAGHGYLISQFLSPYTNRRHDRWGGPFEDRTRLLREIMREVRRAAGNDMAVVVKTNLEDGFKGGMPLTEGIEVARVLEEEGADALILSGGFVSKSSFFMMKGATPHRELIKQQTSPFIKLGMLLFSRLILRDYPYTEAYFLKDALKVQQAVSLPLIYVGGLLSRPVMEDVLSQGFEFVALARALVAEPDFILRIKNDREHISPCKECGPANLCVASMYNGEMDCPFIPSADTRK